MTYSISIRRSPISRRPRLGQTHSEALLRADRIAPPAARWRARRIPVGATRTALASESTMRRMTMRTYYHRIRARRANNEHSARVWRQQHAPYNNRTQRQLTHARTHRYRIRSRLSPRLRSRLSPLPSPSPWQFSFASASPPEAPPACLTRLSTEPLSYADITPQQRKRHVAHTHTHTQDKRTSTIGT